MAPKILTYGLNTILVILNILLSIVTIISAYSGLINPLYNAKFALLGMIFPPLIILTVIALIILLIVKRWKIAIIPIITLIATYSTSTIYFPFNIKTEKSLPTDSTFTLLTYNVLNFDEYQSEYKSTEHNRTAQYIIDMDADIVALQECFERFLKTEGKKMPESQLKILNNKYPYQHFSNPDIAILSKYPINKKIKDFPKLDNGCGCGGVIISLPVGDIEIINTHLQSIQLRKEDKALYREVTSLEHENKETLVDEVRTQLIGKLTAAFRARAEQADSIRNYIDKIEENRNLIVCGDFNDTPASYTYRTIKADMTDAYKQCAFLPTITYHADRFYFRIDQVFYRGEIQATAIKRGKVKSSDHYPLLTTFIFKQ